MSTIERKNNLYYYLFLTLVDCADETSNNIPMEIDELEHDEKREEVTNPDNHEELASRWNLKTLQVKLHRISTEDMNKNLKGEHQCQICKRVMYGILLALLCETMTYFISQKIFCIEHF